MNVASLELRQNLYELSGWGDDIQVWLDKYPPYDLGYLLRKLPGDVYIYKEPHGELSSGEYTAMYHLTDVAPVAIIARMADTPENALCKLALELFKTGILRKAR